MSSPGRKGAPGGGSNIQTIQVQSPLDKNPMVVGLYGISGCGKSYLLKELQEELGNQDFAFFDGSAMLEKVVGSLDAFNKMNAQDKINARQESIDRIRKECAESGRVGLVAGHLIFWAEGGKAADVWNKYDANTYTHILYLNVHPKVIEQRRFKDSKSGTRNDRPADTHVHLKAWQEAEIRRLRAVCQENGIMFSVLSLAETDSSFLNKVLMLLREFQYHDDENCNAARAERKLDRILSTNQGKLETVLVLDADRTLAPQDTGPLFWKIASKYSTSHGENDPLRALFGGPLQYSYSAFRQASLFYEEITDAKTFDKICEEVADAVTIYPDVLNMLQSVGNHEHVGAVIVTCGLQRIWEKVLKKKSLSDNIKVIGGGRASHGVVVTGSLKAQLVARLRDMHHMYVYAFGDSELDLEMMKEADEAIVIVGDRETRSRAMDDHLSKAINDGLSASQVLLSSNRNSSPRAVSPRLDKIKLPTTKLTELTDALAVCRTRIKVHRANDNVAKLFQTPMRDATNTGPVLRDAHQRVARYLATHFLVSIIGTQAFEISHVQNKPASGYQFEKEKNITIVALMRGGEPMALGISDAMPQAMFLHASSSEQLKAEHLKGQHTIVLVDSVINEGNTVMEFVRVVRALSKDIRIVIVTGVVQDQSIPRLKRSLGVGQSIDLVTLRISKNKYTGSGPTDTGDRLFNTTLVRQGLTS